MLRITFVCTGNTCRSPMAEGMFRQILQERAIADVACRSCGLYAYAGDAATQEAILAAQAFGADISEHRSTPLQPYLIDETDWFVCMTQQHAAVLRQIAPEKKITVLGGGIPDPYGGDEDVYRQCAAAIASALQILADVITIQLVPLDDSLVDGVAVLEQLCFSAPWSKDGIRAELQNETAHFLVAASGDKVCGYIGVHEVAGEGYIANLAVAPAYRGYGIASALLAKAETDARARQCAFLSLEVRKSNTPAVLLYQKRGYQTVGERKNFYSAPKEDALIMTLPLTNEE